MRFNLWVRGAAKKDLQRLCQNHPNMAAYYRVFADWSIKELAEDAHKKGTPSGIRVDAPRTYFRWVVGPLTVIDSMLPMDDRTVIIEGFLLA